MLQHTALKQWQATSPRSPRLSTKGDPMFPEFRDLITTLKHNDHHFTRLFDKHNELDQKIKNMEDGIEQGSHTEIETLKREKLQLKDEVYAVLKKASSA